MTPVWIPTAVAAASAYWASRPNGRRAAGSLDAIDPATRAALLRMKPDKLPGKGTDPATYVIDLARPCTSALITWQDKGGKQQKGYAACFHQRGQRKKWVLTRFWAKRYERLLDRLRRQVRRARPGSRQWEASLVALIIADSGVRPGTRKSRSNARYGATTIERRHVVFRHDGTHLHFIGKGNKPNCYLINDSIAVGALRAAYDRAVGPQGMLFLQANENDVNTLALPRGITSKDLRTIRGSSLAARALEHTPSPQPGAKCTAVRKTFNDATKPVSTCLNNEPSMARSSYIDPSVYQEWSKRAGWDDTPCRATMKKAPNGQPWHLPKVWNDDKWMPRRQQALAWWWKKQ